MARRAGDPPPPGIDSELDELFKLPLDEFTASRNALATQLKKAGRRDEAATVQSTPKPSVSAWAVNHVWWNARPLFQQMLDAGEHLREVQRTSMTGKPADLRGAVDAHQQSIRAVVNAAVDALGGDDRVSPPIRQRIATTCDAIASLAVPHGVVVGRLTEDLQPAGFAALTGFLSPAPSMAAPRVEPEKPPTRRPVAQPERGSESRRVVEDLAARRREQEEARAREERLHAARESVAAAQKELARAEDELSAATRAADEANASRDRAAARLAEAEAARERARAEQADASRAVDAAHRVIAETRAARERAAKAVAAAQQKLEKLVRPSS